MQCSRVPRMVSWQSWSTGRRACQNNPSPQIFARLSESWTWTHLRRIMSYAACKFAVMHPSKFCIVGAVNDSLTLLVLEWSRTINNTRILHIYWLELSNVGYVLVLVVTSRHPCTVCPILMFAIRQAAIISDLIYGVFMRMSPGPCYQSLYPAVPHIISTYPHTPGGDY